MEGHWFLTNTLLSLLQVIDSELKSTTIDMRETFLSALAADGAINEPALSTEKLGEVYCDLQRQVRVGCVTLP